MSDRDEFDRIVENLELDVSFPDDAGSGHPSRRWTRSPDVVEDEGDEAFYRHPDQPEVKGWRPGLVAGWAAVLGPPLTLVLSTVVAYILPRSVLVALALIFVAGSIYLISQLPEHGPSRDDDPDDGAVL